MALASVGHAASVAGGLLLGGAARALGSVRPAAKPLHPKGRVLKACLYRNGLEPPLGVEFLDTESIDEVVVRESRAIGLPGSVPDIQGLAIRVPTPDGGYGDLLFATTGWGRLTRFTLTTARSTYGRPMTTLLPYRTEAGPVLLGAKLIGGHSVELACAVGEGEWRRFADLVITEQHAGDPEISFDPVLNTLPGLEQYDAVAKLRSPAYDQARASRD
jgi:hypothetical protein